MIRYKGYNVVRTQFGLCIYNSEHVVSMIFEKIETCLQYIDEWLA